MLTSWYQSRNVRARARARATGYTSDSRRCSSLMSFLRSQQCSKGFHKTVETGDGPSQAKGDAEHDLPG